MTGTPLPGGLGVHPWIDRVLSGDFSLFVEEMTYKQKLDGKNSQVSVIAVFKQVATAVNKVHIWEGVGCPPKALNQTLA